jgi:hypothetical protein
MSRHHLRKKNITGSNPKKEILQGGKPNKRTLHEVIIEKKNITRIKQNKHTF